MRLLRSPMQQGSVALVAQTKSTDWGLKTEPRNFINPYPTFGYQTVNSDAIAGQQNVSSMGRGNLFSLKELFYLADFLFYDLAFTL